MTGTEGGLKKGRTFMDNLVEHECLKVLGLCKVLTEGLTIWLCGSSSSSSSSSSSHNESW